MKIKDIYKSKNTCAISIAMAVLCIIATVITAIFPDIYTKLTYAFPVQYPWQLFSGIFVHGSPDFRIDETIGHLGFNLLLVLPFGIMLEKILGSKKFLIVSLGVWVVNAITFYTIAFFSTSDGENTYGAGISGIAFFYGMVGLYALYKIFMQNKKLTLKQISFYLLLNIDLIMLIMINPVVAGVSSMIMHLVAVIFGIIFLIFRHSEIDSFITA